MSSWWRKNNKKKLEKTANTFLKVAKIRGIKILKNILLHLKIIQ